MREREKYFKKQRATTSNADAIGQYYSSTHFYLLPIRIVLDILLCYFFIFVFGSDKREENKPKAQ